MWIQTYTAGFQRAPSRNIYPVGPVTQRFWSPTWPLVPGGFDVLPDGVFPAPTSANPPTPPEASGERLASQESSSAKDRAEHRNGPALQHGDGLACATGKSPGRVDRALSLDDMHWENICTC